MKDWFLWKGESCKNVGIIALSNPSPISPNIRTSDVEIPGRSGKLIMTEGDCVYDSIDLSVSCVATNMYDANGTTTPVRNISGWLRGEGEIVFSNMQEGYYKGININQVQYDKIVKGEDWISFSVQWSCEPFFYLFGWKLVTSEPSDFESHYKNYATRSWNSSEERWVYTPLTATATWAANTYYTKVESFDTSGIESKSFTNQGNIPSAPLIRIEFDSANPDNLYERLESDPGDMSTNYSKYYRKSEESTYIQLTEPTTYAANTYYKPKPTTIIYSGSETMIIEDAHDLNYIILDCEAKIAYTGSRDDATDPYRLRTGRISSGDWMEFTTGTGIFTWTGPVTHFMIDPRWRCI